MHNPQEEKLMIGLLQRVTQSSVEVDGEIIGNIDTGLMVLIGIEKNDVRHNADRLLERILSYRIFPDDEDKMNRSLQDIKGGLLLVPQFTLAADTKKGTRPGFSHAASPRDAELLFRYLTEKASAVYPTTASGKFGADMKVSLINDGPVTFWLQV